MASKLTTLRAIFQNGTGYFDPPRAFLTSERDGFKIDDPSCIFSNTGRDTSTPRASFRPRNGIASKLVTPRVFFRHETGHFDPSRVPSTPERDSFKIDDPRAFFRTRNGILRPLAHFFDNGTGYFDPSRVFFRPRNGKEFKAPTSL